MSVSRALHLTRRVIRCRSRSGASTRTNRLRGAPDAAAPGRAAADAAHSPTSPPGAGREAGLHERTAAAHLGRRRLPRAGAGGRPRPRRTGECRGAPDREQALDRPRAPRSLQLVHPLPGGARRAVSRRSSCSRSAPTTHTTSCPGSPDGRRSGRSAPRRGARSTGAASTASRASFSRRDQGRLARPADPGRRGLPAQLPRRQPHPPSVVRNALRGRSSSTPGTCSTSARGKYTAYLRVGGKMTLMRAARRRPLHGRRGRPRCPRRARAAAGDVRPALENELLPHLTHRHRIEVLHLEALALVVLHRAAGEALALGIRRQLRLGLGRDVVVVGQQATAACTAASDSGLEDQRDAGSRASAS